MTRVRTVPQLVGNLVARGVRLAVTEGGDLKVNAPTGVLTHEDVVLLRTLKGAIIAHLAEASAVSAPAPAPADGAVDGTADAVDGTDVLTCTAPGCTAVVDVYDEHGRPWCTRHRPDAGPIEPTPEPPPWRCVCGGEVSGLLPRCPTCLRQSDGRPSPCTVCRAPVVRRPPPPRDTSLRTPVGEEPPSTGPGLEVFCPAHRRAGHLLHVACVRGWPACTLRDGTTIAAGKDAWLQAVREHGDERWYLRALVELGAMPPVSAAARA
jgi:hypothetical protein